MTDKTMSFGSCREFTDALYLAIEDIIALREDKQGFEYTQNCIGQGYVRFFNGFKIDYEVDNVYVRFDIGVHEKLIDEYYDIYLVTTEDNQLIKRLNSSPVGKRQVKLAIDWIMHELNEEINKRRAENVALSS